MAAAALLLGACAGVSSDPGDLAVDWQAGTESLTARDFTLVVDGVTFHGIPMPEIKGSTTGAVLDVSWMEGGYPQRVHFDFDSDGAGWYIGDVRARMLDDSDWYEEAGHYYTTPPGEAYEGDLDFTIDEPHVTMHFGGARLAPLGIR